MKKVVNAIIRDGEKVLVVKRKNEKIHPDKWLFPGGIVEKGESNEETLKREVKEEVGLDVEKILGKISEYKYPRENNEKTIGKSYLVKTKNKKVIPGYEISEFRWVTIEEFEDLGYVKGMDEEIMKAIFESTK